MYGENKSFKKTSEILQDKYKKKITRQTIMNWDKWMKTDIRKIYKNRIITKYCKDVILSKQKNFKIEILNDINKLIHEDSDNIK